MSALSQAEYRTLDATALAARIRDKEVSAQEVTEAAISAIEALNPKLNAVTVKLYEFAREGRDATPASPFNGVPFLLKDVAAAMCQGAPCTLSSRLLEHNIAPHDSEIVKRFRDAGLSILGRTNLPNFGPGVCTQSRFRGATPNPWDFTRSSGGSSGGSAVAVASGMVPMAHATDAAGSLRIPASHCGLIGLKTTRGRVPAGPDLGELAAGLGTAHVVTRSVRDCAAALDAISGPGLGDPYQTLRPATTFLSRSERDPKALRIGVITTPFYGGVVDGEVKAAVNSAAAQCRNLGHRTEEGTLPFDFGAMGEAFCLCHGSNLTALVDRLLRRLGRDPESEEIEPSALHWARQGSLKSASAFAEGIKTLHRAGRQIANAASAYDVLLMPTVANPPPLLGEFSLMEPDFEVYKDKLFSQVQFTVPFNCSGQPAISLPTFRTQSGLPIGIQFVASFSDEAILLSLAGQFERAGHLLASATSMTYQ